MIKNMFVSISDFYKTIPSLSKKKCCFPRKIRQSTLPTLQKSRFFLSKWSCPFYKAMHFIEMDKASWKYGLFSL